MFSIRKEKSTDIESISKITKNAFQSEPHSQHNEHKIIEKLRHKGKLTVSLVAERQMEVVGHIAFSPVVIRDTSNWYGLGPLSVCPQHQNNGLGTALVNAGLNILKQNFNAQGCVVLGEPSFYERFQFTKEHDLLLLGVLPDYFLARSLDNTFINVQGTVLYDSAFFEL